jgi:sec-independent protein translocase protein TatB
VNISFFEIVVVFLVALLLFGPEQLPKIARQLGAIAAEFRKGTQALRREWYNAVYPPADEIRRDMASHTSDLRALKTQIFAPPSGAVGTPTAGGSKQASQSSHAQSAAPHSPSDTRTSGHIDAHEGKTPAPSSRSDTSSEQGG